MAFVTCRNHTINLQSILFSLLQHITLADVQMWSEQWQFPFEPFNVGVNFRPKRIKDAKIFMLVFIA